MTVDLLIYILAGITLMLIVVFLASGRQQEGADEETADRPSSEPPRTSSKPPKASEPAAESPTPSPAAEASEPHESPAAPDAIPRVSAESYDELEMTKLTVMSMDDDDVEETETKRFEKGVIPIIYDDAAAVDEPTGSRAYILVSAVGQTDRGKKRKRNEDQYLIIEDPPLYIVADGMGGHARGDLASTMATEVLANAFKKDDFAEDIYEELPRRGREVVLAIQRANRQIWDKAETDPELEGMGTTIICARFSPNKQRVYIGHVGDSRCYLLRAGEMRQLSSDHNIAAQGYTGPFSAHLTRALGAKRHVIVDLILGKPKAGDIYLLCSDGLNKMLDDDEIRRTMLDSGDPDEAVQALIEKANEAGGKDNVTAIMVLVMSPKALSDRPKRGLTEDAPPADA